MLVGVGWHSWCWLVYILTPDLCHFLTQSAAEKRQYALELLSSKEAAVGRRRSELRIEAEERRTAQLLDVALRMDVDLLVSLPPHHSPCSRTARSALCSLSCQLSVVRLVSLAQAHLGESCALPHLFFLRCGLVLVLLLL